MVDDRSRRFCYESKVLEMSGSGRNGASVTLCQMVKYLVSMGEENNDPCAIIHFMEKWVESG